MKQRYAIFGRINHRVAVKQGKTKMKEIASRRLKQFILTNTDHRHLPHLSQVLRSPLENELSPGTGYEVVPLIVLTSVFTNYLTCVKHSHNHVGDATNLGALIFRKLLQKCWEVMSPFIAGIGRLENNRPRRSDISVVPK